MTQRTARTSRHTHKPVSSPLCKVTSSAECGLSVYNNVFTRSPLDICLASSNEQNRISEGEPTETSTPAPVAGAMDESKIDPVLLTLQAEQETRDAHGSNEEQKIASPAGDDLLKYLVVPPSTDSDVPSTPQSCDRSPASDTRPDTQVSSIDDLLKSLIAPTVPTSDHPVEPSASATERKSEEEGILSTVNEDDNAPFSSLPMHMLREMRDNSDAEEGVKERQECQCPYAAQGHAVLEHKQTKRKRDEDDVDLDHGNNIPKKRRRQSTIHPVIALDIARQRVNNRLRMMWATSSRTKHHNYTALIRVPLL